MNNVATEQTHLAKLAATHPHKRFCKLYRLISNRRWLEAARDAIRTNKGFNTPGVDGLKGSDLDPERLARLADKLQKGTYEPKPVRRTFVPKRNGKLRPLGLPSAEDKVVQSAIKLALEPIYEQMFRDCSHGFRPRRSGHTALRAYALRRTPTWTIEGDIESCFDSLSHGRIVRLLRQKIADERLIELVRKFLKAGYLQDWQWHATWSGSPQGHVLSPVIANVVGRLFGRTGTVSLTAPCVGRNARPHSGITWNQALCCGQLPEDSTSRAWDATPQEANVLDKDKKGESVTGEGET